MNESNSKHVKGDKLVSHDAIQSNHGRSVYTISSSSKTELNSHGITRDSSSDIYFR